jgi:hypothetical protein
MWYVWWRIEVHAVFWWGNLKERVYLDDGDVDGRVILKYILRESVEGRMHFHALPICVWVCVSNINNAFVILADNLRKVLFGTLIMVLLEAKHLCRRYMTNPRRASLGECTVCVSDTGGTLSVFIGYMTDRHASVCALLYPHILFLSKSSVCSLSLF